jgi:hypothetical protein
MIGADDEETMMTATIYPVIVPAEAWDFVEHLGVREAFESYLSMAEAFYRPFAAMTVQYDPYDPTFEDEQLTLQVDALPGGRVGSDADLEWMKIAHERFGGVLCSRITPISYPAVPSPEND